MLETMLLMAATLSVLMDLCDWAGGGARCWQGARLLVTSHTTRRAPAPAPAPASRSTDTVWNVRVPGILAVLLVVADRISSPLAYFQTIWTTEASEI